MTAIRPMAGVLPETIHTARLLPIDTDAAPHSWGFGARTVELERRRANLRAGTVMLDFARAIEGWSRSSGDMDSRLAHAELRAAYVRIVRL